MEVVGTVTIYELDGPGFESRQEEDIFHIFKMSTTSPRLTQSPILSRGWNDQGVKLTTEISFYSQL
jgi:hypothetical protein